ncbi:MAG: hypothetical protein QOJ54_1550 [Aliidongia sp.]|jgi:hypothetical protein|nr:hypothetical protein [Aliidongia sp.]
MRRILSTVVIPGLLVVAAAALAQEPVPARIRGTIAAVDSQTLTVTTKGGATETVTLKPGATVNQVVTTKLSEIKPNSFVGVTALPGEGGVMTAVEVHIFPEAARGTGEGHRPWDLGEGSTMTNGTVGNVSGTSAKTITVKYGSDEKTITVPETVPIVTFVPGDIGELVKGAHVVLFGQKAPDGMVTVARIAVGKDGLTPPM